MDGGDPEGSPRIGKYHGDGRIKPVGNETVIQGRLNSDHWLFPGALETKRIVVVTSYGAIVRRHGPRAQHEWKVLQGGWEEENAGDRYGQYDDEWPSGLAGLFETVVLDEAHLIKNVKTEVNGTIPWLQTPFHLFLTAAPLLAGARDAGGYIALMEEADTDWYWRPDLLEWWQVSRDFNPYVLLEKHPATKMCLTLRAAQTYIFSYDTPGATQGTYLCQIWKDCMIRRTFASTIPLPTGGTISSELLQVKNVVVLLSSQKRR